MSARVVSAVEAGDRLVARKRSRNDADALRLLHEAEVLALARHPGVVELVGCVRDGEGVVLTTEFVGTHSLDTLGPVTVERAAGLIAALAETIADLHDVGVVHGRVDPSHVLIGIDGRPILCGFAGGGRVGSTPPPSPPLTGFSDPAASNEAPLSTQRDVHGLGCLLRSLILDDGPDVEPIPERRFALDRFRAPWSGFRRRALLTLADRATDDVPSRRPPARRLAHDLLETIPGAALVGASDTNQRHVASHRGLVAKLLVGGAVAVTFFSLIARGENHTSTSASAVASTTAPAMTARRADTTTTAAMTTASSRCHAGTLPITDDLDGDGCGDEVHVEDGRVVVVGSQRFLAGEAGDRVAVGDWDCDGTASVAVLRPASGAIFVFDRWATATADVSVPPVSTVADAVDLESRDRGNGCTGLVAVRRDGTLEEVL